VLPFDQRRGRRNGRARRRPNLAPPERLEGRELLAYTPLGVSLPDLTVSGFTGPVAAYSVPPTATTAGITAPLTVTVDVRNLGASSLAEPFNLAQAAVSNADAPPSEVGVFLSPSPGARGRLIGTIPIPRVPQNSIVRVTATVTVPTLAQLGRRFPAGAGTLFVSFRADVGHVVREIDERNNRANDEVPVQLAPALPDLQAVALDIPPGLQPGETIQPTIRIANFGTVPSNTQGPVTVFLVASQDPFFGPGDALVQSFTIDNIPALAQAPTRRAILGDVNLDPPPNVVTLVGPVVTLPTVPDSYFLGLVVDPNDTILEITELGVGPSPNLQFPQFVSGVNSDLAVAEPTGLVPDPANQFPIPPFGPIFSIAPVFGLPRVGVDSLIGPIDTGPVAIVKLDPTPSVVTSSSVTSAETDAVSARSARGRARRARR
jgi:hypothetical protein